jgi:hypothetical protein
MKKIKPWDKEDAKATLMEWVKGITVQEVKDDGEWVYYLCIMNDTGHRYGVKSERMLTDQMDMNENRFDWHVTTTNDPYWN